MNSGDCSSSRVNFDNEASTVSTVIEGQSFTVLLSVYIVLYVILGGVQSVLGPLAGAAFFTLLPELFRMGKEWRYVLFAAAVILLMAWRPQGLLTANPIARSLRRRVRQSLP